MPEPGRGELSSAEARLLTEMLLAGGAALRVERDPAASPEATVQLGRHRWRRADMVEAVARLYSRGLLRQHRLNRFELTAAGRARARALVQGSNGAARTSASGDNGAHPR